MPLRRRPAPGKGAPQTHGQVGPLLFPGLWGCGKLSPAPRCWFWGGLRLLCCYWCPPWVPCAGCPEVPSATDRLWPAGVLVYPRGLCPAWATCSHADRAGTHILAKSTSRVFYLNQYHPLGVGLPRPGESSCLFISSLLLIMCSIPSCR